MQELSQSKEKEIALRNEEKMLEEIRVLKEDRRKQNAAIEIIVRRG